MVLRRYKRLPCTGVSFNSVSSPSLSTLSRPKSTLSLLLLPLTIALICLSSFVSADSPGKGYHSDHFDHAKYGALRDLLITPATHPQLFSFTGRWTRSHEIVHATRWPGNSFTALIYGDYCSIKIRPKTGMGMVTKYSYYVSIDGGEDMRYDLPGFDSGKEEDRNFALFVPIRFDLDKVAEEIAKKDGSGDGEEKKSLTKRDGDGAVDWGTGENKLLKPHTIRVTSIPETPFSFEGLLIQNTIIRQGWDWSRGQDERVRVEFVGEGVDAERLGGMGLSGAWVQLPKEDNEKVMEWRKVQNFMESVQWKAAERLKLRHWHISSGSCLLSDCDPKNPLPGLSKQYFQLNPMNSSLPFSYDAGDIANTDPRHPSNAQDQWLFNPRQPWVPSSPPSHVVVDTGIPDLLMFKQDPKKYKHELLFFLARIRTRAHPDAKILVVGRKGRAGSARDKKGATHAQSETDKDQTTADLDGEATDSLIPTSPEMTQLRNQLYDLTQDVVTTIQTELGDKNTLFMRVDVSAGDKNAEMDLTRALCRDVVPPPPLLDNLLRTAGGKKGASGGVASKYYKYKLSHAQLVCADLKAGMDRRDWVWGIIIIGLALGMGVVAKDTMLGAFAALCGTCFEGSSRSGSRRDEAEEGLLAMGGDGKGKMKAMEKLG